MRRERRRRRSPTRERRQNEPLHRPKSGQPALMKRGGRMRLKEPEPVTTRLPPAPQPERRAPSQSQRFLAASAAALTTASAVTLRTFFLLERFLAARGAEAVRVVVFLRGATLLRLPAFLRFFLPGSRAARAALAR